MRGLRLIAVTTVALGTIATGEGLTAQPFRAAGAVALGANEELRAYTVTDLGTFGTGFAWAEGINDAGWVTGTFGLPNQHAFLWRKGLMTDLGTLGGPNSGPGALPLGQDPGPRGQVVGAAETSTPDPLAEGFCGFLLFSPTSDRACLPFVWQNGVMTALPTLGGTNGGANDRNRRGQVVGTAENTTLDASCSSPHLQFRPVIWQKGGAVQQLPTVGADPDGLVNAINDHGQAVGPTGNCNNSLHAVLWQNGKATDLGSLGGTSNIEPTDINNDAHVVGFSDLPGDTTSHAFLWLDGVMTDLGTLPGDHSSFASAVNGEGQVVGTSLDVSGSERAFIWQDGNMTDLNSLIPTGSPLSLLMASGISARGEIVGLALQTGTGEFHAYLAAPSEGAAASVSANHAPLAATAQSPNVLLAPSIRKLLSRRLHLRL